MIDNEVLKSVLAESKAEFVQANIWTLSTGGNSFVRRWLVDRSQAQAAEEFLRTYLSANNYPEETRSITNPWASGKREGVYRGGRVMAKLEIDPQTKAEEWFVYQELRKGFVESLVPEGGVSPAVNWSEFVLLKESGYHANHEMPVLRLNNVAPSAVHSLVSYLNQDSFTDIVYRDGTLSGAWRRVEVLSDQEDDGSYRIDVLLTDSANTSLYVRFLAASNVWKGIYHKWDADETTIAELEATIQFNATGEIVTSGGKTLREAVAGRTVSWTPVRRANDTRLFELVAEIVWVLAKEIDTSATPHGAFEVETWMEVHTSAASLPLADDLVPLYDAPGKGNADHVPGDTEWGTSGVASDPLVYGLWSLRRDLTGPTGSGLPKPNEDGTYDYAIVNTKTKVVDAGWHMFGGINHDTIPKETTLSRSFQQIEVRVGGDLEFEKGGKNGTELVGIDWNNEWDAGTNANGGTYPNAIAPDNWVSHGYQARYGDWRSYWTKGYKMGPGSLRTNSSRRNSDGSIELDALQCRGPKNDYDVYQIGDVVWDTNAFKVLASATEWSPAGNNVLGAPANNVIGYVRMSGNKVYTCVNSEDFVAIGAALGILAVETPPDSPNGKYFWSEGAQNDTAMTWSAYDANLVVAKVAKSGVGEAPFEQADLYVPILEELNDEVEWDSDWEWKAGSYPANSIVFYLPTGLRYKSNKTTSNVPTNTSDWAVTTENPTGWSGGGYSDRHGDWKSSWTKGYATGAGSIRTNPEGATICRGVYLAATIAQVGDVFLYSGTLAAPVFKIVSGATEWSPAGNNGSGAPANNVIGYVRMSGNKVYTCVNSEDFVAIGAALSVLAVETPPDSPNGKYFWSEGARSDSVTLSDFDKDYVVSKIAKAGVGSAPFETAALVGILDSSEEKYALSKSARVLRYVSPEDNPRMCEIISMTKQQIQSVAFDTHFAFNPKWLSPSYWRIESAYASLEEIYDAAYAMTNGKLTIPYNSERSNFSIKHELVDMRDGTFAIRKTIELRGNWEPDAAALYARGAEVVAPNTYGISGRIITIYTDLTGVATKPWPSGAKPV